MVITAIPSQFASAQLQEVDVSFSELVEGLTAPHEVGEKGGEGIIPAVFAPCPSQCRQHEAAERAKASGKKPPLDCGGGKLHRLNDNVTAVTWFGGDLDHLDQHSVDLLLAHLRALGVAFIWWHTHSHRPAAPRIRLLIPLKEPLPVPSAQLYEHTAWPALAKFLGIPEGSGSEDCKDPCHIFYTPRKPTADAPHSSGYFAGEPLDWRPVLESALAAFARAKASAFVPRQAEDPGRGVDLDALRERLKRSPSIYCQRVARGQDINPKGAGGKRSSTERIQSRYMAWLHVTSKLSLMAEDWMSSEQLLRVLKPSWHVEADMEEDPTNWEDIVQMLESARRDAPEARARRQAERRAQLEADRALFWRIFEAKRKGTQQ